MRDNPLKTRRPAVRLTLALSWLAAAAGGVAALVVTPATIASEMGVYLTYLWGGIVAVASLVAGVGVLLGYYRLEWVAAWFASGGLSLYVVVLWSLVFTGQSTRMTQAFMLTALLSMAMSRAAAGAAHASRLRDRATETGSIHVP